jgi:pimeloyl-ACP methyl ester carboxylesterase
MQKIINGQLVNYEVYGHTDKVMLFLHGWADSLESFRSLAGNFSSRYKVIILDLPGFGKSDIPSKPFTIKDFADFVSIFLKKLDITHINVLVGHSNGGSIAIKAVSSGLINPNKLVLLSSAGIRPPKKISKYILSFIAKGGKAATSPLPDHIQEKLQKKLYKIIGSDFLINPAMSETFKNIVTEDLQNDAKKIKTPTILIYGDLDKATPIEYAKKYKSLIDGSKLVIIPDAGHHIHTKNINQITDLMKDFI